MSPSPATSVNSTDPQRAGAWLPANQGDCAYPMNAPAQVTQRDVLPVTPIQVMNSTDAQGNAAWVSAHHGVCDNGSYQMNPPAQGTQSHFQPVSPIQLDPQGYIMASHGSQVGHLDHQYGNGPNGHQNSALNNFGQRSVDIPWAYPRNTGAANANPPTNAYNDRTNALPGYSQTPGYGHPANGVVYNYEQHAPAAYWDPTLGNGQVPQATQPHHLPGSSGGPVNGDPKPTVAANVEPVQLVPVQTPPVVATRDQANVPDEDEPKPKRQRMSFTRFHLYWLEHNFHQNMFISRDERSALADKLGVTSDQVKLWYQNRRMKRKKMRRE